MKLGVFMLWTEMRSPTLGEPFAPRERPSDADAKGAARAPAARAAKIAASSRRVDRPEPLAARPPVAAEPKPKARPRRRAQADGLRPLEL